jgi:hypothetical protein
VSFGRRLAPARCGPPRGGRRREPVQPHRARHAAPDADRGAVARGHDAGRSGRR